MNKITCKDIYGDILFNFDDDNPLIALSESIVEDETNAELYKILVTDVESLVLDYFLNRYDRIMSPLFLRLDDHNEDLRDTADALANIIKMKFLYNWNKLAEAVFSDYNPIDNYNMVENRSTSISESATTNNTESVVNKFSGFNTDSMKDVSESDSTGNIETSKSETGSKANNELTRRGNIGVTTTAQMIEGEYKLRKKNVIDLIYKDIDTILFIDYYC